MREINLYKNVYAKMFKLQDCKSVEVVNESRLLSGVSAGIEWKVILKGNEALWKPTFVIDEELFQAMASVDVKLTRRILRFVVGHELAHLRQYEMSGIPSIILGEKYGWEVDRATEKEATAMSKWATGLSGKDIKPILEEINKKSLVKFGCRIIERPELWNL
jgi:hypothetical protein